MRSIGALDTIFRVYEDVMCKFEVIDTKFLVYGDGVT